MHVQMKAKRGLDKQELTSPTVATELVFITAVVDAHKGRDVACFDIPGAFLHMDSDEDIAMILKGRLAELIVQVAPNLYRKYITVDRKGTAILYVRIPLCQDAEGYVWALEECLLVLQEACS